MACRSACMPAPPPESDPAMVYTMGGGGVMEFFGGVVVVGRERDETARTRGKDRKNAAIFPVGTIIVQRGDRQ